jgi:hypothetical protein
MKKTLSIILLLCFIDCYPTRYLSEILTHIIELPDSAWKNEYYVDISSLQLIYPNKPIICIEEYLKSSGFVKSKLYTDDKIYYYRWISLETKIPVFNRKTTIYDLNIFKKRKVIAETQPENQSTFDGIGRKCEEQMALEHNAQTINTKPRRRRRQIYSETISRYSNKYPNNMNDTTGSTTNKQIIILLPPISPHYNFKPHSVRKSALNKESFFPKF